MAKTDEGKLLSGVLDTIVLQLLESHPSHGYGLCELLRARSDGVFAVKESVIYTALYRLERKKLITHTKQVTPSGQHAKVYTLTGTGKRELTRSVSRWEKFSSAVSQVLKQDPNIPVLRIIEGGAL